MTEDDELPLVYSPSGCSSAAQMANDIAVSLDRDGVAEMSCIAGVGGDVDPLVETATSGRPTVVIDGCPLQCAKRCLDGHGERPDHHFDLSAAGVPKEYHTGYDDERMAAVRERIAADAEELTA
jgi:uncharacterized metal-binding protein